MSKKISVDVIYSYKDKEENISWSNEITVTVQSDTEKKMSDAALDKARQLLLGCYGERIFPKFSFKLK